MTDREFEKIVSGPRPAFSERHRMSEQEFRGHIEALWGVSLQNGRDKSHAQRINTIRRFYFKIVVE